ncbi:aminoacyl-histidine dipeptidase [Peptoniphilus sp. oral taxon 386]|uniref:aminoacyl-histidine dipeptidase n=1 Tax=Peptoniphilus sp. oral taxon 386 TaxID=652713 RepID=UPI0001DA9A4D|nr:aminoacyl-histidine dipeptidase [Peptoniphilus sp. oral taxon 386]EFI41895.1 Xaa-His dipeptidase [Peptoniphilus sp. oral taxon 386 str. F0131]
MNLNIEPKEVFKWFYEINQIPRCSGSEKRVSDFLVNFAKERNLEVFQDDVYNVIIKKPATNGYENSKPVIIQGHMDMVCVKEEDSDHNFDTDPIEMIVDGDFVKANKTTLGADDGIAVAYALAILDSNEYKHPALEVLITTNEETGMDGAAALKEGMLNGNMLLNIDSEEEGIFLVSCAGGSSINVIFDIEREHFKGEALRITVRGLKGGHSGGEIIRQRANANKILSRLLSAVREVTELRIISLKGGAKHNAIPDSAKAEILVEEKELAIDTIEKLAVAIKNEYRVEDDGIVIDIESCENRDSYTKKLTDDFIDYSMIVPDGVISMSKDIEGLVETSLNNAVLFEKDNKIVYTTSVRSSTESELERVLDVLKISAKRCNAKTIESNRYPAWQFEEESILRDISIKTYEELFCSKATYSAIHAGLECGLLKKVLPNCDMISFGPEMHDVHSPKERVSISSTERMWKFTLKLLENLK